MQVPPLKRPWTSAVMFGSRSRPVILPWHKMRGKKQVFQRQYSQHHNWLFVLQVWWECRSWSRLRPSTTWRLRSASWIRGTKTLGRFLRNWRKTKNFSFSSTAPTARPQSSLNRCVPPRISLSFHWLALFWLFWGNTVPFYGILQETVTFLFTKAYFVLWKLVDSH